MRTKQRTAKRQDLASIPICLRHDQPHGAECRESVNSWLSEFYLRVVSVCLARIGSGSIASAR